MVVCFDFETTSLNTGNPFTPSNKVVSYSLSIDGSEPEFHYYTDIEFWKALKAAFKQATRIIGFNLKFDLSWASRYGIKVPDGCRIWDCQIAEFLISGQTNRYPSLKESLIRIGEEPKSDILSEYLAMGLDTLDVPEEELKIYNNQDVRGTYKLAMHQLKEMPKDLQRLCSVQGMDLLVLQEMEENGQLFDRELCDSLRGKAQERIGQLEGILREYFPLREGLNLGSGHHMSALLYGGYIEVDVVDEEIPMVYKSGAKKGQEYIKRTWKTVGAEFPRLFNPLKRTETKLRIKNSRGEFPVYQAGVEQIQQLRPRNKQQKILIETLLEHSKVAKLLDTYYVSLPELMDEMEWGDYLHGNFNQTTAATGRLSSSKPNMQNFSGEVDELLVTRY